MITLLAPSKTQKIDKGAYEHTTNIQFKNITEALLKKIVTLPVDQLGKLMNMSDALAQQNFDRFQNFSLPLNQKNGSRSLFLFKGAVYDGLDLANYSQQNLKFAQNNLRILSGLYGILRPLDLIMPYRLEMGLKWKTDSWDSLYHLWKKPVTEYLNAHMLKHNTTEILNLASTEYFKVIDKKILEANVINAVFKEAKDGKYKTIAIHAKRARGKMADYIIKNQIVEIEEIKNFNIDGYCYNTEMSDKKNYVFLR